MSFWPCPVQFGSAPKSVARGSWGTSIKLQKVLSVGYSLDLFLIRSLGAETSVVAHINPMMDKMANVKQDAASPVVKADLICLVNKVVWLAAKSSLIFISATSIDLLII